VTVVVPPVSSSCRCWGRWAVEDEKVDLHQVDSVRPFVRAGRADDESTVGGGGKEGTMTLAFSVLGSVGIDEE